MTWTPKSGPVAWVEAGAIPSRQPGRIMTKARRKSTRHTAKIALEALRAQATSR